jgi:hypothetical protein
MADPAPKGPPGLAAVLRMMFLSGVSDEAVENFVRLYTSEATVAGQPPIIELAPIIGQATQTAARLAVDEALAAVGLPKTDHVGGKRPSKPSVDLRGQRDVAAKSVVGSSYIYRIRLPDGFRTSVSIPMDLVRRSATAIGEAATKEIIASLAKRASGDLRRSTFVQLELRKTVEQHERAHRAPSSMQ